MLPVLTDMLTDAGNRSDVRRFLILTILCRNVTLVWKLLLFKKEKNMANMINRNRYDLHFPILVVEYGDFFISDRSLQSIH